jgi:uncharacterized membrane protein (DUF4010 family)
MWRRWLRPASWGAQKSGLPVLAALTTNTVTKMVVAISSGRRRFALQIIPG